jgi:hypothetical protein
MKILDTIKQVPAKISDAMVPAKQLYLDNASTVNAFGAIGFSCLSTAAAIKNSKEIIETINDIQAIYPTLPDEEHRREFLKCGLKKLAPLIAPIVGFEAAAITFIMLNKKQLDEANKKVADLTATLIVAQNAIGQYQEFKKKAEEELSAKKLDKVNTEVAKETIEKNPQTPNNTANSPFANENYLYYVTNRKDYVNSKHSPVEIENFCKQAAYDLKDGNLFGDEFTYNDVYDYMAPGIADEASKWWGWTAEDVVRNGMADSSEIRIDIIPSEMDDHQTLCYELTLHGNELFTKRRRK